MRDSTAAQLGEIETRRAELAMQASNGTLSDEQRVAVDAEYQALGEEAERITQSASFNGKPVFSGESTSFQVGLDGSEGSTIELAGVTAESLISEGDLLSKENALSALTQSKEAVENISQVRGEAGSTVSRIEVALNNVLTQKDNALAAESRIRDADIAQVAADKIASEIRTQAGVSALSANNLQARNVLALLG